MKLKVKSDFFQIAFDDCKILQISGHDGTFRIHKAVYLEQQRKH